MFFGLPKALRVSFLSFKNGRAACPAACAGLGSRVLVTEALLLTGPAGAIIHAQTMAFWRESVSCLSMQHTD